MGAVIGGHVIAAVVVVAVPVAIVVADVAIVVAVVVVGSSLHHHTTSQCYWSGRCLICEILVGRGCLTGFVFLIVFVSLPV